MITLPPKVLRDIWLPMTPCQVSWYRTLLRCRREAQAIGVRALLKLMVRLRQLSGHPHVTRWLGWFASSTAVGLLLELAPGGDCQQLLQRHGAFALKPVIGELGSGVGLARAAVLGESSDTFGLY